MQTFFNRYSDDLQVMANLQGTMNPEGLLKVRGEIDRMKSQNMRQVALAIWSEKVKVRGTAGRVGVRAADG